MEEIWKPIEGYEGFYEVSSLGRVRSIKFRNGEAGFEHGKIMSLTDNGHGYLIVGLNGISKRKNYYVHRLVAKAFIPNPKHLPVVDHIDHDRSNNVVTNLQWMTQKDNIGRSIHLMSKPRKKPMTNTGERYISRQKNGLYRVTVFRKQIGTFDTIEAAKEVRDEAVKEAERV